MAQQNNVMMEIMLTMTDVQVYVKTKYVEMEYYTQEKLVTMET